RGKRDMIGIFTFGAQTELRYLGDLNVKSARGEELCLLYKLTMVYLFVPLFLSRDGYVLGIVESRNPAKGTLRWSTQRFYPLPPDLRAQMQAAGQLPAALPAYKLRIGDHWPLWLGWLFAGMVALGGIASLFGK